MVAEARGAGGLRHVVLLTGISMALVATSLSSALLSRVVRMVESIVAKQRHAPWVGAIIEEIAVGSGDVGEVVDGDCCSGEICLTGVGPACFEAVVGGTSRLATIQPGSATVTRSRHLWLGAFGGRSDVSKNTKA